jgi:hypothetical protein
MPKHIMGRVTANRKNWDDVACLHVERNHIVGCSYLDIIDSLWSHLIPVIDLSFRGDKCVMSQNSLPNCPYSNHFHLYGFLNLLSDQWCVWNYT